MRNFFLQNFFLFKRNILDEIFKFHTKKELVGTWFPLKKFMGGGGGALAEMNQKILEKNQQKLNTMETNKIHLIWTLDCNDENSPQFFRSIWIAFENFSPLVCYPVRGKTLRYPNR